VSGTAGSREDGFQGLSLAHVVTGGGSDRHLVVRPRPR